MPTPRDTEDLPKPHVSELSEARERFLSRVVDHALTGGFRSSDDFLKHFPPAQIIASLSQADALRVKVLVSATGTHEKIALKKSVASATEDLELALAEQTTTPNALVGLYPADDKVRYLDAKKLWAFAVEDEFHHVTKDEASKHARAASRLAFIVECALSEGLITLRDVADGMTFDEIALSLPIADVRDVVKHALQVARAGAPLTEERFLAVVPLPALVSHVALDHTWHRVVLDKIAEPAALVGPAVAKPAASPEVPSPPAIIEAAAPVEPEPVSVKSDSPRTGDEDEVRRRVIERLRVIDRLPPSNANLSTAIMLSIESMYADLWAVSDDDEREACIRESFPNQTLLRTAMLALIELLDPSVDTQDPIIRDADVSGLMKIVLFEERRRRDASPAPQARAATSTGSRGRRSVPPPLPRASSTPPPLPADPAGRASAPPPLPAEMSKRES